ncbi:MAG: FAD-binding oxidoreductase [Rhodobacterales bacterium]|jgi:glycine oxidase|nr:FAD-binding oxidoreductase [Rhodobacterales bacterium]
MKLKFNAHGCKMTTIKSYDVIIIGAGIFGLSCAYACAGRNLSVLVVDAKKIGFGASGGILGAMAPYTPDQWHVKKEYQFQALSTAEEHWQKVDGLSSLPSGYGRIGRISPIIHERVYNLALTRHEEAKRNWKKFKWNVIKSHELVSPDAAPYGLIHDTLSARIFPSKALASLAQACSFMGVEFRENTYVSNFDTGVISGSWGNETASSIIIATGYEGFDSLEKFFPTSMGSGVKGQAALLNICLGDAPQIYANGVYVVPHNDGTTAIGSTSENKWTEPHDTDAQLNELIERARIICPKIKNAKLITKWAGVRPKARRREPLIGKVPMADGIFLAMGGFKIGFGIAHKIGLSLADLIENKPNDLPKSYTIEHHLEKN